MPVDSADHHLAVSSPLINKWLHKYLDPEPICHHPIYSMTAKVPFDSEIIAGFSRHSCISFVEFFAVLSVPTMVPRVNGRDEYVPRLVTTKTAKSEDKNVLFSLDIEPLNLNAPSIRNNCHRSKQ